MITTIKATCIGGAGAGKTAFFERFVDNTFNPNYIPIDFKMKYFKNNATHKWQLCDLSGQEHLQEITSAYLRGSNTLFIFVNSTRPVDSIKELTGFRQYLLHTITDEVCAVIFTRSDHEEAFKPTKDTCLSYVADVQHTLGIPAAQFSTMPPYFVTSAKESKGISEAMEVLERLEVTIFPAPKPSDPKTVAYDVGPLQKSKRTTTDIGDWWNCVFSDNDG